MPRDLLSEIRNSGPRDLLAEMRAAEMREALKDVEREREVLADLNREDARKNESIVDRAKRTAITQAASLLPLKGAEVAAGVWAGQNPDRATEVVKKSPAALGAGAADAAAGIAGAVEGATEVYDTYAPGAQIEKKLLGRTTVSGGLGQFAKQRREGWSQLADEVAPTSDNEIVQDVLSGVRSVPTSLGAAAASIATGNPLTGAAMLGATTGGLSYGEARDAGLLPGAAAVKAAMDAGIELGTEYGPQKALSRLLKPGESLTKTLVKYGLGELGGEQLATLGQDYNQWLLVDRNKGKSFDDYLAEIPDHAKSTLIATVTTTGVVAGVGATVRAGANAADKFRARRQGAPEQPGVIDQAGREAATLTPEDEASALPNDLIAEGKKAIAENDAALAADERLEAAGLPRLKSAIEIVDADGNAVRGTVEDVFEGGFKLQTGEGTTLDYYLDDINDAGDTIRPLLTAEEINAEAAARADAAKAEMERLRAEAANRPATEAPGVPTVPQTVPRAVPQAGDKRTPVEDGVGVARSIFGDKARITSGYRGPDHALSKKNPNSWHAKSRAAVDMAPIPGMTFDQAKAAIEGQGYTLIEALNETGKGKTKHATGDHWHFVIGKGGAPVGGAPAGGANVGDIAAIQQREDDENPYTKALEEYRRQGEAEGEAAPAPFTAAPIPDDPTRPDPASVYTQQNVTPDAEATSPADGIGGGPPQPGGDAAAPISESLDQIKADAQRAGVSLSVRQNDGEGTLRLENIARKDAPKGAGAEIIERLNRYADRAGLTVELEVNDTDAKGLVPYYERFGFEAYHSDESEGGQVFMERPAQRTGAETTPAVVDQPVTTSPVVDRAGAVGETQAAGSVLKPVTALKVGDTLDYGGEQLRVERMDGDRPVLSDGTALAPGGPPKRVVQARATNPVTPGQGVEFAPQVRAENGTRAPIITRPGRPEDERVNRDVAISPTGREAPVEYRVAELGDIVASHTPDGAVNPAFPAERQPRERDSSASRIQVAKIAGNLNPRLLGRNVLASDGAPIVSQGGIVEAGNGRIAALDLAYQQFPDKAQAYRDYLKQEGFDVEGMERPVLVRVLDPSVSAEDAFALTRESNQRSTAEMSVTEQAAIDAEKLTDDLVNAYRGGSPTAPANVEFVKRYFEEVADPNARATLYDNDGKMTQAAQARITAALLQRAFGNRELVKDVAESTDPDVKAIGNVLSDVAGMWARMKAAAGNGTIDPQFDITENVNEAVSIVAQARKTKRNVAEFVAQNGIFTGKIPARTEAVLRMMFRNPNFTRPTGQAPLKQMFEWYIEQAMQSSGLFASPDATPDATLSQAREKTLGEGIDVEPDAGRPGDERIRGSVREGGTGRDGPDARVPEQRGTPGEGEGRQSLSAEPSSDTDVEAGTTAEAAATPPPSAAASAGSSIADEVRKISGGVVIVAERKSAGGGTHYDLVHASGETIRQADFPQADWPQATRKYLDDRAERFAGKKAKPEPKRTAGKGLIGQNAKGVDVFEDENGVRSYVENGIRITESVGIVPGRGIYVDVSNRWNEYKTTSELEQDLFARFPEVAAAADRILEQAAPHQQALGEFAKPFGKLFSNPGLKGKARIVEKVTSEAKYENDPATLKDIVRGAFFVDTPEQAAEAEAALRAAFTIAEDKGWQIVDGNYFDHKFIIDFGDGIRGEIQIVPAAVWEHKKGAGDKAYVQWRRIEDPQSAEAQRLLREMEAGYSKALSGTAFESAFNALKSARGNASAASAGVSSGAGTATLPGDGSQADFLSDQASANQRPSRAPVAISQPSSSKNLNNVGITSEREVTSNGEKSKAASDYGANNRLVTQARREELRRLLQEKLNPNRLNSLIDPTILAHGAELGVFHLEAGARKFADFAKAVAADLGVRPVDLKQYLRAWYNGARDMMEDAGAPVADMDTPDQVRAALARLESEPAGGISEADADATAAQAPRGDDRASDDGSRAGDAPRVEADGDAGAGSEPAGRGGTRDVRDDDGRGDDREQQSEPQSDGGRGGSDAAAGQRGGNRDRAGDRVRRKSADRGTDYLAPRGSLKRAGSWKATAERNLDVIELVNRLDAEGRAATPDEQKQLAAFTGWGASEIANGLLGNVARKSDGTRELRTHSYGAKTEWNPLIERAQKLLTGEMLETALQSTQYAHYTSEEVIRSIWDGMERLGFTGGRILEPGMGNGLFAVAAPGEVMGGSSYTGIEMDAFTAKVAGYLLPQENVLADDYTKVKLPDGFFDVAIGNPPFANIKILDDPAYKKHRFSLHDYFFAKSIDKVRPGGLMVFVTSRYTMDKQDAKARQYLADRADLLGAIRLPQTAFKENAGTEVVTDVLFFQRRAPGQEPGGQAWLGLKSVKAGTEKVMVNEYFAANPKMVLGKHATTGSMYRANEYTVEPMASMSIEKAFARAIEALPQDVYTAAPKAAKEAAEAKTFERDFAPASTKEGGLYLKDGALMVVEDGSGVPLEVKPSEAAWLKDYVPLRDALKQAQKDQLQDGDWEKSLKALNKAYDAFAKKHGPIAAFTTSERRTVDEDGEETVVEIRRYKNKRLLAYDVESPLVTQLERVTDEGKIERGPFLAGRTLNKPTRPEIATVQDALAVTLDEIGRLDLDYIGKQLGLTREQVIEDLGDSIYEAPDGIWQTEDEYLSGNVVEKLEEAEKAAAVDPRFERNVKALLARQPTPLAYSDINVKLGVGWIKPEYIGQFAREVLGERPGPISYNPTLGTWEVDGASNRFRRNDTNEYGTSDRSPLELLDALLNNRTIKITRTDSDKKTYVDATATVAANEAAKKISERFKTWIWEDGTRAGELADYYNRNFNNLAPRQFNGDHLTLPGLAAKFAANTHPHVKRAVWRQIQTGNTYLAHAVGAGKTREMIIGGMEQKRLGLIKKPMYVVPNHMLEQFRAEFLEAYPAANLLVADEQAFHTDNRKRFMAQAALNDPDAIIVTHSSFGKIDTSDEARAAVVQDLIGELEAAAEEMGDDRSVMHTRKKIERQIEQIKRRFAGKIGTGKDRALTFEEMGVDFLYIDEAHEFRKLDFATNRTAKGIDPVGSQKALDLFIKIRWLESQRPGRSVVLASGTPVTNTMAELFTVMRYMAKDQLDRDGIGSFDGWAAMFGEVAAGYEQNAAGGYEIVERFAKFVNVPELMKRVRTFMDVLTSDQLGDLVKRPKVNGGVPHSEVVPASEALEAYMKLVLDARLKKSRAWKPSKEQPGNPDPVINIISDARLSAIDMRFVRPGGKPDPNSKLNRMLDKIVERYKATRDLEYTSASGGKDLRKGGVQIVFSAVGFGEAASRNRGFNLREWVDGQLVAGGIKKAEIAWMSDANTHAKKAQLQKDVRAGKIAVLIGSPKNMGTGLNVQKRLRDLHYLSPPWYPSDVEQPHGRIIRQGNENPEVDIWWYAAKGTYDSTAWGMVSRKQKFIEQALTGDKSVRVLEDISESSQYEMAAALAAGDERIIQVAGLSAEVDRLQRLEQAHADNQRQLRRNIRDLDKHGIPQAEALVKRLEAALEIKREAAVGQFFATIGGKTYEKPGEAGAAIIEAATEATRGAVKVKRVEIGKLRGKLPITIEPTAWGPDAFAVMVNIGPLQREIADRLSTKSLLPFEGVDPVGMVRKAENALMGINGSLRDAQRWLAEKQAERAANEKRIGAPFAEAGVLAEKVAERAQLQAELASETAAKEAVGKGAGPAATPIESRPDVTQTPAFKRWFGKSKVVDAEGQPRVVYHRTDAQFDTFDTADFGSWFAELPETAEKYGDRGEGEPRVIEAFVKAERPLLIPEEIDLSEMTSVQASLDAINEANGTRFKSDKTWPADYEGNAFEWIGMDPWLIEQAKAAGFDSLFAYEEGEPTWNVFDPAQIKSATDNSGAFDPANPSILASRPDLFDEPAQPTRTMTEAQRAELEARQKQGMARRGGQQGLGDQEGGLFASERDQGTLFRVSDGEPATRRNLKDLERDLNARLEKIAGKRVQLRITDRIGMAGAGSVNIAPDGRYWPSMKLIEVASDALHGSTFTLDHEAVHALRDLGAFSPTDWMILKNAARKDAKLWASIQRRYANLHEEAQLEEAVADMFAQFQEAGDILGKLGRAIAVALTKALKVLEAIRESLRGNGFAIRRTAGDVMLEMRDGRTKADIGKFETGNAHNKEMVVHHGTPHEWEGDRADLSKIGTGEGAQVYGWGLYFAGKREVAEHYRKTLSKNPLRVSRAIFGTRSATPLEIKEMVDQRTDDRRVARAAYEIAHRIQDEGETIAEAIKAAKAEWENNTFYPPEAFDKAARMLEGMGVRSMGRQGRLYTVDIPEDGEYLLWDQPTNKQPGKVRAALSRIPPGAWEQIDELLDAQGLNEVDLDDGAYTGGEVYRMLSRVELDVPTDGSNGKQDASLLLKSLGIRGIKYLDGGSRKDGDGSYNYVVFDDADVKVLAKESRPPLAPVLDLAGTDPTFKGKMADAFELFRMKTQDRYITLKKAQRKIERVLGRPLPDSMDVYKGEELMHGRMAERIDRLHEKLVRPLFDAMADANVSLDELETFLYARHARERNAQIAKINPDMPDGGSGMTNTAARAILNRVARSDKADAMNALAARVDAIRESTLDAQVEYGLISAKQAAEYRATYQAYVPLRGFKEMAADPNADPAKTARVNRSGGGINVRGPESKRAFGRRSEADSPLSYLILQAQEAIVRGETNRVGQQLYELAKNAKDGEFWTINKPTTARKLNEETGLVEEYTHHQLTAADAPYTVVVKVEGKERRITFNRDNPNARRMADAMRRLSDSQMDWFTKSFGVVNRWLSAVNTRWNAEFVFTNMFRDLQTAAINLQGIDVPGIAKKSAKHYAWALKASMKGAYGKGDQWYDEFVMEGAKTAFARIENIDDLKKDLSAEFAMAQSRAGTDKSLGLKGKRAFRRVVDIVENANDGVENAARLAAYRAAREAGVSKKQAASIAKNLTVNFNRRGQFGPVMNALYLFYNASVQGNVRILQAMYHSKKVRGVVAGIAVAGFMSEFLNAMLSDDDEDGESFYDKIPAFEKERNMIVMLDGENYITIPMPWGYNVFYEAGRVAAEVARRGGQRWEESASHLATTMLGAFNPIGFSWEGRSAQEALVSLIMPSALDPVVDLSQNRDFTGRPIMPEENQFGPQDPDFRRYWPGVDKKWKAVTDFLNEASGGNKVEAGYVDVSPETLDYLAHTALGAAGALADRLIGLPAKTLAGEATREDIPLVRKAFGEKSPYRDKSEFYARMNEVEAKVKDGTDLIEAEMWGELDAFKADHERVLQMQPIAKEAKKVMRQIRKDRRANDGWLEKGQIDEAAHADNDARLDEIESTVVTNFNRQWISVVYGRDSEAQ